MKANHPHQHSETCGHTAILHYGHTDYLHDGHLHTPDGDEHVVEIGAANPEKCTGGTCAVVTTRPTNMVSAADMRLFPTGDHTDYLVNGHLHHPDGDHCDHHGDIQLAQEIAA